MATTTVRVHLPQAGPFTVADFAEYAQGEKVQVCRIAIENGSHRLPLELYLAHHEAGPTSLDLLPPSRDATQVLVHAGHDPLCGAVRPADAPYAAQIAAAVAVMQVSWGWDERDLLPVRINDEEFVTSPRYEGERRWQVEVRDRAV